MFGIRDASPARVESIRPSPVELTRRAEVAPLAAIETRTVTVNTPLRAPRSLRLDICEAIRDWTRDCQLPCCCAVAAGLPCR